MPKFETQPLWPLWQITTRSPAVVHDQQVSGMQVRMKRGAAYVDHGPKPYIECTAESADCNFANSLTG